MAHVDRRTVFFERKLDDLDGAVDACTKPTRAASKILSGRFVMFSSDSRDIIGEFDALLNCAALTRVARPRMAESALTWCGM